MNPGSLFVCLFNFDIDLNNLRVAEKKVLFLEAFAQKKLINICIERKQDAKKALRPSPSPSCRARD